MLEPNCLAKEDTFSLSKKTFNEQGQGISTGNRPIVFCNDFLAYLRQIKMTKQKETEIKNALTIIPGLSLGFLVVFLAPLVLVLVPLQSLFPSLFVFSTPLLFFRLVFPTVPFSTFTLFALVCTLFLMNLRR